MITREQAQEKGIAVDAPEIKDALMDGLCRMFVAARENALAPPFHVTVLDSDNGVLREFVVEESGTVEMGHSDGEEKLFLFPLTIYLVDGNGRAARLRVPASPVPEPVEVQ